MKLKELNTIRDKSEALLKKDAQKLYEDIAKLMLDRKVNPPKDSNEISKKRKQLAVILTVINEKKINS